MTRHGIIEGRSDGYHRQFYIKPSRHIDRATLAILRQKRLREIILLTLVEGKVKYQTLLTKMQIPASTLSFYLQRLVQHEILARHHVGREHLYTVMHPDTVKQLLITYQSSFLDRFVDNAIASWMELRD
jgi:predicted transcriptional regulator